MRPPPSCSARPIHRRRLGLFVAHSAWAALIGFHLLMAAFLTVSDAWPKHGQFRSPGRLRWIVLALLVGLSGGLGLYWLCGRSLGSSQPWQRPAPAWAEFRSWPFFILYFALINPPGRILLARLVGQPIQTPVLSDLFFAGYPFAGDWRLRSLALDCFLGC